MIPLLELSARRAAASLGEALDDLARIRRAAVRRRAPI
jgi:hypothetical protein